MNVFIITNFEIILKRFGLLSSKQYASGQTDLHNLVGGWHLGCQALELKDKKGMYLLDTSVAFNLVPRSYLLSKPSLLGHWWGLRGGASGFPGVHPGDFIDGRSHALIGQGGSSTWGNCSNLNCLLCYADDFTDLIATPDDISLQKGMKEEYKSFRNLIVQSSFYWFLPCNQMIQVFYCAIRWFLYIVTHSLSRNLHSWSVSQEHWSILKSWPVQWCTVM